jgi:hypothetical protein
MLKAVGYAGIMDLDYRFDKRDGRYKLLDFKIRARLGFTPRGEKPYSDEWRPKRTLRAYNK